MLATLPDECKQLLWGFLDAHELCRMACVARSVEQGVALAPLWQLRAVAMVRRELQRLHEQRTPGASTLQRQNAARRLDVAIVGVEDREGSRAEEDAELLPRAAPSLAVDTRFWKHWYRDFFVSVRASDIARVAFDNAKNELQELKKQRSDLRELAQALKSNAHSDKQLRRMQMNCVRWFNRTARRTTATNQARTAQHVALSKNELQDQLQAIENTLQMQAKALFSLRSQLQKSQNRLTNEVARGRRVLADLGS